MPQRNHCKSIGCTNPIEPQSLTDFCPNCLNKDGSDQHLSVRYPQQYRSVGDMTEVDVFAINHLFKVHDPAGCLQHAVGRLLMASTRTTTYADIREARDTLTRWLQLNQETPT